MKIPTMTAAATAVAIASYLPEDFWPDVFEKSRLTVRRVARAAMELEKLATVGDDRDAWGVTHDWEWAARATAHALADGAGASAAAAVGR